MNRDDTSALHPVPFALHFEAVWPFLVVHDDVAIATALLTIIANGILEIRYQRVAEFRSRLWLLVRWSTLIAVLLLLAQLLNSFVNGHASDSFTIFQLGLMIKISMGTWLLILAFRLSAVLLERIVFGKP